MTNTEGTVTGAGDPRAAGQEGAGGAHGERDLFPGEKVPGEGPAAAADNTTTTAPEGDAASELAGDLDELVRTAAQRDEYLALAQRTQADFENYRKRVAREAAMAQERGAASLAKELLPALDNLDRALEEAGTAAAGGGEDDPLL